MRSEAGIRSAPPAAGLQGAPCRQLAVLAGHSRRQIRSGGTKHTDPTAVTQRQRCGRRSTPPCNMEAPRPSRSAARRPRGHRGPAAAGRPLPPGPSPAGATAGIGEPGADRDELRRPPRAPEAAPLRWSPARTRPGTKATARPASTPSAARPERRAGHRRSIATPSRAPRSAPLPAPPPTFGRVGRCGAAGSGRTTSRPRYRPHSPPRAAAGRPGACWPCAPGAAPLRPCPPAAAAAEAEPPGSSPARARGARAAAGTARGGVAGRPGPARRRARGRAWRRDPGRRRRGAGGRGLHVGGGGTCRRAAGGVPGPARPRGPPHAACPPARRTWPPPPPPRPRGGALRRHRTSRFGPGCRRPAAGAARGAARRPGGGAARGASGGAHLPACFRQPFPLRAPHPPPPPRDRDPGARRLLPLPPPPPPPPGRAPRAHGAHPAPPIG